MLCTHALGRILDCRSHFGVGSRHRQLRQSKIQNLRVTPLGYKNICRLDVAVHDSLGMRGVQGVGHLNWQWEQNFSFDRLSVDAVLQRLAIEKFHGNEGLTVVFADFMDGANIWMVQGGSSLCLAVKASQRL